VIKIVALILPLALIGKEANGQSRIEQVLREFQATLVGSHYDCEGSNVVSSFIEALASDIPQVARWLT